MHALPQHPLPEADRLWSDGEVARIVLAMILVLGVARPALAEEGGAGAAETPLAASPTSAAPEDGAPTEPLPEPLRDPRDAVERQLESLRLERDVEAIAGPALEHATRALARVDSRRAIGDVRGAERALDIARAALVLARRQIDRARENEALEAARRLAENAAARARAAAEALRLAEERWAHRGTERDQNGPDLPADVRSPVDGQGDE